MVSTTLAMKHFAIKIALMLAALSSVAWAQKPHYPSVSEGMYTTVHSLKGDGAVIRSEKVPVMYCEANTYLMVPKQTSSGVDTLYTVGFETLGNGFKSPTLKKYFDTERSLSPTTYRCNPIVRENSSGYIKMEGSFPAPLNIYVVCESLDVGTTWTGSFTWGTGSTFGTSGAKIDRGQFCQKVGGNVYSGLEQLDTRVFDGQFKLYVIADGDARVYGQASTDLEGWVTKTTTSLEDYTFESEGVLFRHLTITFPRPPATEKVMFYRIARD